MIYIYAMIWKVETGEIICDSGKEVTEDIFEQIKKAGIKSLELVDADENLSAELLLNTIKKDPTRNTEESLNLMYQHIRSGEPPNLETAQKFIERMFFSPKRYDLGKVGRYRLNKQFDLDVPLDHTVLTTDDMIKVIEFLIEMRKGNRGSDDDDDNDDDDDDDDDDEDDD